MTKKYDSTLARMAGNIASGFARRPYFTINASEIARLSVEIAKAILKELEVEADA